MKGRHFKDVVFEQFARIANAFAAPKRLEIINILDEPVGWKDNQPFLEHVDNCHHAKLGGFIGVFLGVLECGLVPVVAVCDY